MFLVGWLAAHNRFMANHARFLDEQPVIDTGCLVLQPIERSDADAMFAMDSNPKVHARRLRSGSLIGLELGRRTRPCQGVFRAL